MIVGEAADNCGSGCNLLVRFLKSDAIISGTASHLLRSEPPIIAVRWTYLAI